MDENITLAQAENVGAVDKKDKRAITLNIRQDGSMNIATIKTTPHNLQMMLTTQKAKFGSFPVIIRADGKTKFLHVDKAMDSIKKSGLFKVSISAQTDK